MNSKYYFQIPFKPRDCFTKMNITEIHKVTFISRKKKNPLNTVKGTLSFPNQRYSEYSRSPRALARE